MPGKAFLARFRSPEKQLDLFIVEEDLPDAKENAKDFFRAIGHLGEPHSSLKIGQLHSVEDIEALLQRR